MSSEKKQTLLLTDNTFDLTRKHRCFLSDGLRSKHNNPIINNFDTINNLSLVVKKDDDNLYCVDGFQLPYEDTIEIDINGDTYTMYYIYEIEESSNVPSVIFEESKDDIYLYSRDKRDITIRKVYKSIDRKEIYIIPFAGYSLEGSEIVNLLINVKMQKHNILSINKQENEQENNK